MNTEAYEDQIAERFPDDAQRATRRNLLFERLGEFLDEGVVRSDGGWAAVERSHIDALHLLIGEVIDLKIERDPDGDRTVQYVLCNRRTHNMHVIYETNRPQDDKRPTAEETISLVNDMQRETAHAHAIATRMSENVKFELEHAMRRIEVDRQNKERIAALNAAVTELPYDEACDRLLVDQKHLGGLSSNSDIYEHAQDIMAIRFSAALEEAIVEIASKMALYVSDNGPHFNENVRIPRTRYYRIFGGAFMREQRIAEPTERLYVTGAAERKAVRLAKSKA